MSLVVQVRRVFAAVGAAAGALHAAPAAVRPTTAAVRTAAAPRLGDVRTSFRGFGQ
jgi:hypothetical protein